MYPRALSQCVVEEEEDDLVVPMPERFHFSNSEQIAPIWIVPRLGYALTTKERGEDMSIGVCLLIPQGSCADACTQNHGYDNEESASKAIATRGVLLQAGSSHIAPANARANANAWHSITDEAHHAGISKCRDIQPRESSTSLRSPSQLSSAHAVIS